MGKKLLFFLFLFCIFIALSGCTNSPAQPKDAAEACQQLCKSALATDLAMPSSACIGNPMQSFPDYVCDLAHNPREAVDDLPENQCSAYREGKAKRFVEVDTNCNVIKIA